MIKSHNSSVPLHYQESVLVSMVTCICNNNIMNKKVNVSSSLRSSAININDIIVYSNSHVYLKLLGRENFPPKLVSPLLKFDTAEHALFVLCPIDA